MSPAVTALAPAGAAAACRYAGTGHYDRAIDRAPGGHIETYRGRRHEVACAHVRGGRHRAWAAGPPGRGPA